MDRTKLLARRATLHDEAQAILAAADDLTDEKKAEFDAKLDEIGKIDAQLSRLDKLDAVSASLDKPQPRKVSAGGDTGPTIVTGVKERVQDDPKRGFATMGEFAQSVYISGIPNAGMDERLVIGAAATGMSQGVGPDGGFLVPPAFSNTIYAGLSDPAESLLAMTDSYPVDGDSLTFNANAETSRATGSRWGGIRAYWIAEADQITGSRPKFREAKIEPKQLAVLVYATDKLIRNAAALTTYISRAATDEINFLVGDSIINGTGAGMPTGIVGHSGTVSVSAEAGQAAATLVKKNLDKMWAACHAKARRNSVWFINQNVEPELNNIFLTTLGTGTPAFMPAGGISGSPFSTLYGRPIMPIEYCAALGTVGDVILGDMKAYLSGTQGGVDSAMSIHLRFDYAESVFRFMFAVDGQPWNASKITPFKGTADSLSPFVTLATR